MLNDPSQGAGVNPMLPMCLVVFRNQKRLLNQVGSRQDCPVVPVTCEQHTEHQCQDGPDHSDLSREGCEQAGEKHSNSRPAKRGSEREIGPVCNLISLGHNGWTVCQKSAARNGGCRHASNLGLIASVTTRNPGHRKARCQTRDCDV